MKNVFIFGFELKTTNMKKTLMLLFTALVIIGISSCKKDKDDDDDDDDNTPVVLDPITDIDGNSYKIVKIGSQTWMAENLKTTRYSNGDSIPITEDNLQWKQGVNGVSCYYENNIANRDTFGMLYNYHAMKDARNACPTGWRVPTTNDWVALIEYLGGNAVAGQKLKATTGWDGETGIGANIGGFTAYPAGLRNQNGGFNYKGRYAYFWTSTELDADNAWVYNIDRGVAEIYVYDEVKLYGHSCRCIKN